MSPKHIVLDENIDWRMLRLLTDHHAKTVKQLGYEGMFNGDLLNALNNAIPPIDLFITADQNIVFQNYVAKFNFGILVIKAKRLNLAYLAAHVEALKKAIQITSAGKVVEVLLDPITQHDQ